MSNQWGQGDPTNIFTNYDPPTEKYSVPEQRIEVGGPSPWFGGAIGKMWKLIALGVTVLILMLVATAIVGAGLGIITGVMDVL